MVLQALFAVVSFVLFLFGLVHARRTEWGAIMIWWILLFSGVETGILGLWLCGAHGWVWNPAAGAALEWASVFFILVVLNEFWLFTVTDVTKRRAVEVAGVATKITEADAKIAEQLQVIENQRKVIEAQKLVDGVLRAQNSNMVSDLTRAQNEAARLLKELKNLQNPE